MLAPMNSTHPLLLTAALRAIEQDASAHLPAGTLMDRAGAAAAALTLQIGSDRAGPVWILVGPGNNGGDALILARLLREAGVTPEVALLEPGRAHEGDARAARLAWTGPIRDQLDGIEHAALIVDGLYGIGLNRPLSARARDWVERVNHISQSSACPVLALDIPSGLHADSGARLGECCIVASHTLTFIADKPGLHTLDGPDCAGQVFVHSLGLKPAAGPGSLNAPAVFAAAAQPRRRNSHKGRFGNLAVIGGNQGMVGAALLAGRSALHAGAGRVYVQLLAAGAPVWDAAQPELMLRSTLNDLSLEAAVLGPGLGMDAEAHAVLARQLAGDTALVLDADALNLIGLSPALAQRLATRGQPSILTPHPLEAARLLGTEVGTVQSDRIGSALELARRYQAVVVLKGVGSIIAAPDGTWCINPTGNPGLATAGTGDVLAGLAGALLAQGWPVLSAALASAWLHGQAADDAVAAGCGPVGLVASDLIVPLRTALNRLIQSNAERHAVRK